MTVCDEAWMLLVLQMCKKIRDIPQKMGQRALVKPSAQGDGASFPRDFSGVKKSA
eukprot:CAMPEP_0194751630 /NCGR_PEP_ID=MMETSP0323_2-20130528/5628_1 /TAXON_ID=2866 ORGANISM="Crypthecodinium cohnii, Strain Seligo" /NCGR_SAMPLE_ID=MMETSP0323_2 /ASSEMBLY_ACC=CAM_ASM_000346 /LENGTH=54 /DNA_ID=CAMNT_0039668197 /DNA_START=204 /DNA_END=368 /DNA_ORIENTATION=+